MNSEIIKKEKNKDKLTQYLFFTVINDQIELTKLIFSKKISYKILDKDNRNLLYYTIKYDSPTLFKYLMSLDKDNFLLKHSDILKHTNLHYAIMYGDTEKLEIILKKYDKNINQPNLFSESPLHLAVIINNHKHINILLKYKANINQSGKHLESCLHISVYLNQLDTVKLLIDKGINIHLLNNDYINAFNLAVALNKYEIVKFMLTIFNINMLDGNSNTPLIVSILGQKPKMIELILDHQPNVDIQNRFGYTAVHGIFFVNYTKYLDILLKRISHLNFQLYRNKKSILHLLVENKIWKKYYDILIYKKMDISLKDKFGKTAMDYLDEKDKDLFIKMIATSFNNQFSTDTKIHWHTPWQNHCQTKDNIIELKKIAKSKNISFTEKINIKELCYLLAEDQIRKGDRSYPSKKIKKKFEIISTDILEYVPYSASYYDVVFSYHYLLKKYSKLGLYNYPKSNEKFRSAMKDKYKMSIPVYFMDFEIYWVNNEMIIPHKFKFSDKHRYYIIPLFIISERIGGHANVLFYDKKNHVLEHFEPHGHIRIILDPHFKHFKQKLEKVFGEHVNYIPPDEWMDIFSVQAIEGVDDIPNLGDVDGYCLSWCIWYIDMRMKHLDMDPQTLLKKFICRLHKKGQSLKNYIRSYSGRITNVRDNFLKKYNVTINQLLKYEVSDEKLEQIRNDIRKIFIPSTN